MIPDLQEVEPNVFSLLLDGISYEVRVSAGEIFVNGRRISAAVENPRKWQGGGRHAGVEEVVSISAPMPGKIVRVLVEQGDFVEAGQGIVVVEAMKMQNELKSPKAGRVGSLSARAGESVNAGDTLATVE
jgi:biotin carboxyl carrier protein